MRIFEVQIRITISLWSGGDFRVTFDLRARAQRSGARNRNRVGGTMFDHEKLDVCQLSPMPSDTEECNRSVQTELTRVRKPFIYVLLVSKAVLAPYAFHKRKVCVDKFFGSL
ncbi:hypothetical protein ACFL27_22165 [candidate division CSSED10-310 bacterium]|uniref:Uncharacterized protein n=1 Tax=candidate division CSSED10-310 bacterium TaxID=2855610 RepID=A0ABV6Z3K8_UNCC1